MPQFPLVDGKPVTHPPSDPPQSENQTSETPPQNQASVRRTILQAALLVAALAVLALPSVLAPPATSPSRSGETARLGLSTMLQARIVFASDEARRTQSSSLLTDMGQLISNDPTAATIRRVALVQHALGSNGW